MSLAPKSLPNRQGYPCPFNHTMRYRMTISQTEAHPPVLSDMKLWRRAFTFPEKPPSHAR